MYKFLSGKSSASRCISPLTLVMAAISLAIFVYVAIRAATLSITHDEALTFDWHVTGDWISILLYRTPGLPDNNHVLYSLLCKLSVTLFGVSELTLRLPSLLGCLLYLVGLNLCLRRIFLPGWVQVLGLFALGLNPYVVDYLGVARGYGLGLGFTMVGLAALLAALGDPRGMVRSGPARLSVLFFSLATLANFSFLLVLSAGLLVLAIPVLFARALGYVDPTRQEPRCAQMLKIVAPAIPTFAYLVLPLSVIRKSGLFNIGGHNGFWSDTVASLVTGTIHGSGWLAEHSWLFQMWIAATLAILPFTLWAMARGDRRQFATTSAIVAMTISVAIASWGQHQLAGVALLEGRRGIFLIPLFMLMTLALAGLPSTAPRSLVVAGIAIGAFVPGALGVHGLMSTNQQYVLDWKYDAATRDAILAVKSWIGERKPTKPVHLLVNWIFEPSGNFYRRALALDSSLLKLDHSGIESPADLYYIQVHQQDKIFQFGVKPILHSSVAETVLFERTN